MYNIFWFQRFITFSSSVKTLVALGEIRDPGALTLASVDNIVSICTRNLTVLLQRKDEYTDENFAVSLF
jgi:hypothetical protein